MNIKNILFRFFAATALLWAVACEKPENEGDNSDLGGETGAPVTEINGTDISSDNNLIGLVSDASTGKGIAGVAVSDGFSVVKTDANGVYQFESSRYASNVFISLPAEYQVPLDATKKPAYYKPVSRNKVNRNDFTLTPLVGSEENFTLIAIGDPQVSNASEINRFKTETIADINMTLSVNQAEGRYKNAYAVTLGDIVNDTPTLWETMKPTMENVQLSNGTYLPIFQCIGNHDHNAGASDDRSATSNFSKHFGPTDYSFNRGKVHIVVMDNIVCKSTNGKTWDYDAGFSKSQYNWLKADLDAVENKADKMLILCCHIPFRNGAASGGASMNRENMYYLETLALMREWNEAHIMIGHTHYPQNYRHIAYRTKNDLPVYEHVHGGACGGWWSSNMNVDGAPNGYSLYEIEGNHMKNWLAKSTGFDKSYQMRVYNGNQTWTGSKGYIYNWYQNSTGGSSSIAYTGRSFLKNSIVVSLWNDDESNWKVEFTHNGKTTPMTRVASNVMDAAVVSYFFNECGKNTTSWTKALYHYWYLPVDVDPATLTGWTVTATQTIPGSGEVNVYTSGSFQTDYSGF